MKLELRMIFRSTSLTRASLLGAMALLTGCSHDEPKHAEKIDIMPPRQFSDRPYTTSARPIEIRQGELPLVWMTESPVSLAFIDLTTKQTIGEARVDARKIIKLDAEHGIAAGGTTVRIGPLPADHRYSIQMIPSTESRITTETAPIVPRSVNAGQNRGGQP